MAAPGPGDLAKGRSERLVAGKESRAGPGRAEGRAQQVRVRGDRVPAGRWRTHTLCFCPHCALLLLLAARTPVCLRPCRPCGCLGVLLLMFIRPFGVHPRAWSVGFRAVHLPEGQSLLMQRRTE